MDGQVEFIVLVIGGKTEGGEQQDSQCNLLHRGLQVVRFNQDDMILRLYASD
jgi:hypothetical protein